MFRLFLSLALLSCFAGVECRTPTFQPDLVTPVETLKEKLENLQEFNLTGFIGAVIDLVELVQDCTENLADPVNKVLSLAEETLLCFDPEELGFETLDLDDLIRNISWYMNSADFEAIHTYLWDEDEEWNDMIKLFYNSEWNGNRSIYDNLRMLYNFFECDLPIPEGPRSQGARFTRRTILNSSTLNGGSRRHPLLDLLPPFAIKAECTLDRLLPILNQIIASNPQFLLDLVNFVITEVNTNPSVHLFWAKLSEPAKGESFRKLRSLPEVQCLEDHFWLKVLRPNVLIDFAVRLIWDLLVIDFDAMQINIVSLLISSIEYSIWQTPFPYPNATDLSCANPKFD